MLDKSLYAPATTGPIVKASDITWNEGVLRLAAVHGKMVEFRYVKVSGGDPATRRFVPQSVKGDAGSARISFLGPDPDRDNEPRRYRLSGIKGDIKVIG